MPTDHRAKLAAIKRFDQLIGYLRDEMGWPIEGDNFEELTFEYSPEELGIDLKTAAKIDEIKRLRPLSINQPWGIFFVKFEPKRLPVVALRRILSQVVFKKRASANPSERTAWSVGDLLFISNYGDQEERKITFAHFSQSETGLDLPTLKVLGWDNLDSPLHLDDVAEKLTSNLAWPENENDIETWRESWRSAFLIRHREVITTSRILSIRLAQLARSIRDRINTALAIENERGKLTKLLKSFQVALLHDLDKDSFADMYAQTIAYGLLSARITNPHSKTVDDLSAHMRTNPFLQELMTTFINVVGNHERPGESSINFDELGVSDVVDLLDNSNMEAVVRDFGDRNPEEDPVIHFYEDFLQEYDAKKRMQRGVFYTPRPVVSFIVRSVDELLISEFGLEDGLADITTWGEISKRIVGMTIPDGVSEDQPFVQILDPATGTGTFLVESIDVIHETLKKKWTVLGYNNIEISTLWNKYVPKYLLTRLHGYELLMAPYAIAHLKIGLKLYETGYLFGSKERARIYLTNALEPASLLANTNAAGIFDALGKEALAVNEIKRNHRFTVILGNPPYSLYSANLGEDARRLIEPYRFVHGKRIRERGALQLEKNLQDDYVKFFAFSQQLLAASNTGILSFISNSGYFGNRSLRGMREHLLNHFNKILLVDLHGSVSKARKGEALDQNVFDIVQGVGACFLIDTWKNRIPPSVQYLSKKGLREDKYKWLLTTQIKSAEFSVPYPIPEDFLFFPFESTLRSEFLNWHGINEILPINSSGIVTARDAVTIWFSEGELRQFVRRFCALPPDEARNEYQLGPDTKDWSVERAQRDVRSNQLDSSIKRILYRPFDSRFTFYTGQARGFLCNPRKPVLQHMILTNNIGLIVNRQVNNSFQHALVTRCLIDTCTLSSATRETAYIFPLYIIKNPTLGNPSLFNKEVSPNLSRNFVEGFRKLLHPSHPHHTDLTNDEIDPSFIFSYIYSILYSQIYRSRYEDFLKGDFPRIPVPNSWELFQALSELGNKLASLHLVEASEQYAISSFFDKTSSSWLNNSRDNCHFIIDTLSFSGPEQSVVRRVGWSNDTVWIDAARTNAREGHVAEIPGTCGFHGVSEDVWNYNIGGYQICYKWLKDRKDRILTAGDITHYYQIVIALAETIQIRAKIDEVICLHGGWPGAFQTTLETADTDILEVPEIDLVEPTADNRYLTCIPMIPLKVAAGAFGDPQYLGDGDSQWVEIETSHKLQPGMFVAQVIGQSMEPLIPNGSYCLFSSPVEGSRNGKTVLVQLRDTTDPETGNQYTVKTYYSDKKEQEGSWTHRAIYLKPQNPDFEVIYLDGTDENEYRVIAEFIELAKL